MLAPHFSQHDIGTAWPASDRQTLDLDPGPSNSQGAKHQLFLTPDFCALQSLCQVVSQVIGDPLKLVIPGHRWLPSVAVTTNPFIDERCPAFPHWRCTCCSLNCAACVVRIPVTSSSSKASAYGAAVPRGPDVARVFRWVGLVGYDHNYMIKMVSDQNHGNKLNEWWISIDFNGSLLLTIIDMNHSSWIATIHRYMIHDSITVFFPSDVQQKRGHTSAAASLIMVVISL